MDIQKEEDKWLEIMFLHELSQIKLPRVFYEI